jgi:hypothetical protein
MQELIDAINTLLRHLSQTPVAPGSLESHLRDSLEAYARHLQQESAKQNSEDKDEPTVWMI